MELVLVFCFQAEDGIRDLVRSRGLGDVYKRQVLDWPYVQRHSGWAAVRRGGGSIAGAGVADTRSPPADGRATTCLLYTSDAADERSSVDLGGRRIIKKKKYDKGLSCA